VLGRFAVWCVFFIQPALSRTSPPPAASSGSSLKFPFRKVENFLPISCWTGVVLRQPRCVLFGFFRSRISYRVHRGRAFFLRRIRPGWAGWEAFFFFFPPLATSTLSVSFYLPPQPLLWPVIPFFFFSHRDVPRGSSSAYAETEELHCCQAPLSVKSILRQVFWYLGVVLVRPISCIAVPWWLARRLLRPSSDGHDVSLDVGMPLTRCFMPFLIASLDFCRSLLLLSWRAGVFFSDIVAL